jgi:glycosyltransferase involved in cell wall biosynthesis
MSTDWPRISVIIPTYNCAAYLQQAVRSVLEQTYAAHEVIVVDDGSTDDTAAVIHPFGRGIRYVRTANGGAAAARNTGLELVSGDCVAFLDADDGWYPRKLEAQAMVLRTQPEVQAVCCDFGLVSERGEPLQPRYIKQKYRVFSAYRLDWPAMFPQRSRLETIVDETGGPAVVYHGDVRRALFLGNFVNTSSILLKRDAVDGVGRFTRGRRTQEDYEFWLKLAARGPLAFLDLPLLFFRRRPNQLTSDDQKLRVASDTADVVSAAAAEVRAVFGDAIVNRRLGDRYRALAMAELGAGRPPAEARATLKRAWRESGPQASTLALYAWSCLPLGVANAARMGVRTLLGRRGR